MTVEQLRQHRLFLTLNDKRKVFVEEYLTNGGNVDGAVEKAWPNNTEPRNRQIIGARTLKDETVAAIIDIWAGEEPEPTIEEFRKHVWSAIKDNKNGAATAALLSLYAELRGWRSKGKSLTVDTAKDDEILKDIQL